MVAAINNANSIIIRLLQLWRRTMLQSQPDLKTQFMQAFIPNNTDTFFYWGEIHFQHIFKDMLNVF